MLRNIFIVCFILIINSCSNNNQAIDTTIEKQAVVIDTSVINNTKIEKVNIADVLIKMRRKIDLNESDFLNISDFLLNNNDEALSEEAGYTFYEYFKKNAKNNEEFKEYLIKVNNKEKVINALIQIMCLDLGEDNYNAKKLQNDFIIFKEEAEAIKSFEECVNL